MTAEGSIAMTVAAGARVRMLLGVCVLASCGSGAASVDAGPEPDAAVVGACEAQKTSADIRVTDALGSSLFPALAWSGSTLGLAWYDERDGNGVWFVAIDAGGEPAGPVRVTRALTIAEAPVIAAGESGFGIAWEQFEAANDEIYFAAVAVDDSGAVLGPEKRVTTTSDPSQYPAIARAGDGFRVTWVEAQNGGNNEEIFTARLDAAGDGIAGSVQVTDDPATSFAPSVAGGASGEVVAWHDWRTGNGDLFLARFDAAGQRIGADVQLTSDAADSFVPALARGPDGEYAVAWHDNRGSVWDVYLARVDEAGFLLGAETRVTESLRDSTFASIVFTGSEYGIAWHEEVDGNRQRILFARYSTDGARQGEILQVSDGPVMSSQPSLAWTGAGFAVAWQDNRDGNYEIYLALLGCQ